MQKRIKYSQLWPKRRKSFMAAVYEAVKDSAHLIHAKAPPHDSSLTPEDPKQYVVDLEPLGEALLSKHGDKRPRKQTELKKLAK